MPAQSNTQSNEVFVPKTDYAYCKPWGGWQKFMLSYGLKPWDDDDVQEGKAIIQAFRDRDREEWEDKQRQRART